jgi:predicted Zn-dependent protease
MALARLLALRFSFDPNRFRENGLHCLSTDPWRTQAMKPLEPPDSFHLEAAQGWLELGNQVEANEELEKITPQLRVHPDVLELRWQVFAKAQHWDACLHVSDALIQLAPDGASGWIMKSIALYRMKRCQEAWSTLLPVAERFPHVPTVAYDLACYACQLGHMDEARQWLSRAFAMAEQVGDKGRTRSMALDDPDLEPLWNEIENA